MINNDHVSIVSPKHTGLKGGRKDGICLPCHSPDVNNVLKKLCELNGGKEHTAYNPLDRCTTARPVADGTPTIVTHMSMYMLSCFVLVFYNEKLFVLERTIVFVL